MDTIRRLKFNLWYYFNPPWDTGISPPELIDFLANHSPGKALDLGCGTGTNAITLAKNKWQVTAVDFAYPAIRYAQRKAKSAGVNIDFLVGDVTRITGIKPPYDLILDIGCYHGLTSKQRAAYLDNIVNWLSREGTFLIYLFLCSNPEPGKTGITQVELNNISKRLNLVKRQDGTDRGSQTSSWLTFTR